MSVQTLAADDCLPVLSQEVHGLTLAATPQQNINVLT